LDWALVKTVALSCGKCGAPLSVPDGTRYLTCTFCGSRLEVHHEGGAAFTAVLEELAATTGRLAQDVEGLELERDLERLDADWEQERLRWCSLGEGRRAQEPSSEWALVFGLGLFGAGVAAVVWGRKVLGTWTVPALGVVLAVIGVVGAICGGRRAEQYAAARDRYGTRRADLERRLRALERSTG
jgi:hypothetical protein